MPRHRIAILPYQPDAGAWLVRLRDLPNPVWLDSAWPANQRGRWDIVSADPVDGVALPVDAIGGISPFAAFEQALDSAGEPVAPPMPLPFSGGMIGAIAYTAGETAIGLARRDAPGAWAGFYDWALLTDHHQRRSLLIAHPRCGAQRWQRLLRQLSAAPNQDQEQEREFTLTGPWQSSLEVADYRRAFERVQGYIQAGDCYQVNLARRFRSGYRGDPFQAYRRLRLLAAAPYSAYMELPDATLLCLSPERFLRIGDRRMLTQPIKGTAARHPDPTRDRELGEQLLRSAKNRAENLMIVDLLRNDLGQVAETGSVTVSALFELQSFATVHHLVSNIEARLAPDHSALQALAACFPGGSITGAPKRRTMQIIHELEPVHRDYYCGSVFWADSHGNLDSNIAIRTLVCRNGIIDAWAGGGIVADSTWAGEFAETETKMGRLLAALEARNTISGLPG